jgi:hypothetical protein
MAMIERHSLHARMLPRDSCDTCGGRGYYETDPESEDEGRERFCNCASGALRRRVDAGETVMAEWPEEP